MRTLELLESRSVRRCWVLHIHRKMKTFLFREMVALTVTLVTLTSQSGVVGIIRPVKAKTLRLLRYVANW